MEYITYTIFIWEFGTTESSESPEECESSATYINPNIFLHGVRVVYKGGRVFRQLNNSQFLQKNNVSVCAYAKK